MEVNLKNNLKRITNICIIVITLLMIMPSLVYADGPCAGRDDGGGHEFNEIHAVEKGMAGYEEGKDLSSMTCSCGSCGTVLVFDDPGHKFAYGIGVNEEEQGELQEVLDKAKTMEAENGIIYIENTVRTDSPYVEEPESDSDPLAALFSGLMGVLLLPIKYSMLLFGGAIQGIGSLIFSGVQGNGVLFSPDAVLFNKLDILSVNFFDMENTSGALGTMKLAIRDYYYNFRNLATGALLATLAYIGIRMALSTFSEDKAKYKKLLRYWVESFVLLFMLQFIMILIIEVNNQIVGLLATGSEMNYWDLIWESIKNTNLIGFAEAISYIMTLGITAAFFAMYLKRLVVVGFLIVIAPLITITYSIDKVKDGQSQALNNWLKQFMYNVLIQIFHCILYLVFVEGAMNINIGETSGIFGTVDGTTGTLIVQPILSVAMLLFIWQAEKLIKEIFGFNAADNSLMSGLVAGKMLASGAQTVRKAATGVKKTAKGMGKVVDGATGHKVSNWYNNSNLKGKVDTVSRGYNKARSVAKDMGGDLAKDLTRGAFVGAMTGQVSTGMKYADEMAAADKKRDEERAAKNMAKAAIDQLKSDPNFANLRSRVGGNSEKDILNKILSVLSEESYEGHQARTIVTKLQGTGISQEEAINNMAKTVFNP